MEAEQSQANNRGVLRAYGLVILIELAVVALLWALHVATTVLIAIPVLVLIAASFDRQLTGPTEYIQITSSAFELRIRDRYRSECSQLANSGFSPLFFYGEATPLFRLLLIYPAFLFLVMALNREVVAIHNGSRIAFGFPVLISNDRTTYAHPMQLGIKLHTLFQDGTILLTKSFGGKSKYGPAVILQRITGANTDVLWSEHQKRVQALQTAGKQVNRQVSFETFAKISSEA
jgi:hypothetical protein